MSQVENINLPYSMTAEQSVLGGLLIDNTCWDDISPLLTEHNFYHAHHRVLFRVIAEMLHRNVIVDLVTLEREIQERKLADWSGLFSYIVELYKNTPSVSNIVAYAEIVKRDSQSRALFSLGNELRASALTVNSQEKLDSLLDSTEKKLTEMTFNHLSDDNTVSVQEGLTRVLSTMDASCRNQSLVTGTPFGIKRLDENTTGGQPGDLVLLAARPSMGKTALSLKFAVSALNAIIDSKAGELLYGKTVQYFSLEMPAEQILQRMLSMQAKVSGQKFRQAIQLDDEEMAKIGEAVAYMKEHWESRLLVDESNYLTPALLKSKVRRNARQYGMPAVIIVDYIQLMSDPAYKDGKNRHLELTTISRELKALAKEMGCPVIALSQLNRNLEQRANKRPLNSDLRESGSLEQDADLLLFIYRDEVYNDVSPEERGIAELIIGKQRNGPVGTIFTRFSGEYSLFDDLDDATYRQFER